MPDSNALFLKAAAAVMNELDVQYIEADLDGKVQLKDDLDKAMRAFSQVRRRILESEVQCTPADVAKMQALQREVQQASDIQTVLKAIVRVIGFLTSFR